MENNTKNYLIILLLVVILALTAYICYNNISSDKQLQSNEITNQEVNDKEENDNVANGSKDNNTDESESDTNQPTEGDNNSLSVNNNSQKSSVSNSQILSYYKDYVSISKDLCSISDINNDDIPELFIFKTGNIENEIIAYTRVFTYDENTGNKDNNYIVEVGTLQGRMDTHTVLYKMNDGRLLSVYARGGYEYVEYFALENVWLIRNKVISRQTTNYTSGDVDIDFVKCTDPSLFNVIN